MNTPHAAPRMPVVVVVPAYRVYSILAAEYATVVCTTYTEKVFVVHNVLDAQTQRTVDQVPYRFDGLGCLH